MAAFTTIAIIALMAASTGVAAYGQYKQGQAARDMGIAEREAAGSQAYLLEYNARIAHLQAEDAIARGADEESRFRTQVRGAIGAQRAGFAAANIDVGYGSAVDVQADAAYLGELDALTIRSNAAREAWGFQVEEEDLHKRAQIALKTGVNLEAAGRARQTAATLGATTAILGGGASLLQMRYGFTAPAAQRTRTI